MNDLFKIALLALVVGLTTSTAPLFAQDETQTTAPDTGVGDNGQALPSSLAFTDEGGETVTMDNVIRAETAKYMAAETITTGPNAFRHEREGIDLKAQTVIRSNFDLIYSYGVWDVSGGLMISVPDYDLLQLVQVLDENSVTIGVVYPGDTLELGPDDVTHGSHVYLFMRTQPRSDDDTGMDEMRQRQDAVTVKAGADAPYASDVQYDVASFNALRSELIGRAPTEGVIEKGFIDDIDDIETPQYQLINTAGWAGLPARHAFYFVVLPGDDGAAQSKPAIVTFEPPELRYDDAGYWSITFYNADGWVETNPFKLSSREAVANEDGTITININGGTDAKNNIKAPKNWNALFRAYLPVSVEDIVKYRDDFVQNHKVTAEQ
ncbi:MAG: DUF1254 domain-containing protein [Sedimentitalea sp.]|uniref:DUF1254 domain-containing protein n=1 Tax=Sedimentitalea sp. TaxID=2048915 RepID=UPI003266746B